MAHKDLSATMRVYIERDAGTLVGSLLGLGQSLALAREAWINAFDKAAEELEATDAE